MLIWDKKKKSLLDWRTFIGIQEVSHNVLWVDTEIKLFRELWHAIWQVDICRVLQRQRRDAVYIERHQRSWLPTLEVEDGWCERDRETKTSYDLPFSFDKACCVSLLRWLLFPWGTAHQLMLFFGGAVLVWWTLCCGRYCSPSFNISSLSLISAERCDKPWELVVIDHCVHTLCPRRSVT